jgi:hypothetical protein
MSEFAFTINDTVAMIGVKHEDPDPYKNCKIETLPVKRGRKARYYLIRFWLFD